MAPVDMESQTQARWRKAEDPDPAHIIMRAEEAGVMRLICVGTTVEDSALAITFARHRPHVWASIGIHPHEARQAMADAPAQRYFQTLATKPKVVAVGECGLDYFYSHSPKADQQRCLRFQLELAAAHGLPLIFHVREAFADFWPIFDAYPGLRGVIHSFTATQAELDEALNRGLYIGLNGIMTFTKQAKQLDAAKTVPLSRLLLETDAPFLTPQPMRGTICEPKHVRVTAGFLAELRGETLEALAAATTQNAHQLFGV